MKKQIYYYSQENQEVEPAPPARVTRKKVVKYTRDALESDESDPDDPDEVDYQPDEQVTDIFVIPDFSVALIFAFSRVLRNIIDFILYLRKKNLHQKIRKTMIIKNLIRKQKMLK